MVPAGGSVTAARHARRVVPPRRPLAPAVARLDAASAQHRPGPRAAAHAGRRVQVDLATRGRDRARARAVPARRSPGQSLIQVLPGRDRRRQRGRVPGDPGLPPLVSPSSVNSLVGDRARARPTTHARPSGPRRSSRASCAPSSSGVEPSATPTPPTSSAVAALLGRPPAGRFAVVVRRADGSPGRDRERARACATARRCPRCCWLVDADAARGGEPGRVGRRRATASRRAVDADALRRGARATTPRAGTRDRARRRPRRRRAASAARATGVKCLHAHLANYLRRRRGPRRRGGRRRDRPCPGSSGVDGSSA